jgi:HD-like signal output (HDOD) protein
MQMVITADREHKPLYEIENDTVGFNHCVTGESIASLWKLDDSIRDVILYHHDASGYSGANSNIVCTVVVANYFSLVYEVGFAGDRKPEKPDQKIWNSLGIDEDFFMEIMEKLYLEIEKARVFLQN